MLKMVKLRHGEERAFSKMSCQVTLGQGRILSLLIFFLEYKTLLLTHSLTKERWTVLFSSVCSELMALLLIHSPQISCH